MGSFWGLNDAGKQAQGWPREWGSWAGAQATNNWIPWSDKSYANGQGAADWYKNYGVNAAGNGFGPISTLQDYASQIMPGVNDYVTDLKNTAQDQLDKYRSTVPSSAGTMKSINDLNDENLRYTDQTRNANLQDIGDTYSRSTGNENAAYGQNTGDLNGRYGGLIDSANADYGKLRGENADTYAGLKANSDTAYRSALNNTEMLKAGGQFAQAQAARSGAGAVASAAGSLRRMGIDPNSPQAASMMSMQRANQAHAMDDAAATNTGQYVNAKNDLLTGQQSDREKLGQNQLGNEMDLGTKQNAVTTGLSVDQGAQLRAENTRHSGTLNSLDSSRSGQTQGTQNTAMDRIAQNEQQRQQAALLNKTLGTQDWQTESDLGDKVNNATATGINLRNQGWNQAMGYQGANLNQQNAGANMVGNYGNQQMNYATQAANTAMGYGNQASNAYQTAYGYEAPNAGWGAKLLAGMAGPALSMIPGVGPLLSQAISPSLSSAANSNFGAPSGTYSPYGGGTASGSSTSPYGYGAQPQYGTSPQTGGTGGWQNLFKQIGGWMSRKPASGTE